VVALPSWGSPVRVAAARVRLNAITAQTNHGTDLLGRTHGSYVPAALLLVVMALMTASASWLVTDRADALAELAAT